MAKISSTAAILSLVVYREPGPPDATTETYSQEYVRRKSVYAAGGDVGFVVLTCADFDRVWTGLERGDLLGTAFAVLNCLGPSGQCYIGRLDEFAYGWIGDDRDIYGRVLLLQVIPQPDTLLAMAAVNN